MVSREKRAGTEFHSTHTSPPPFRSAQYQLPCSYTKKRNVILPHNPGPDTAKVVTGYIPLALNPYIAPMACDLRPVLAPTKWSQPVDITTALGCIKPSTTTPQDYANISSHKILSLPTTRNRDLRQLCYHSGHHSLGTKKYQIIYLDCLDRLILEKLSHISQSIREQVACKPIIVGNFSNIIRKN